MINSEEALFTNLVGLSKSCLGAFFIMTDADGEILVNIYKMLVLPNFKTAYFSPKESLPARIRFKFLLLMQSWPVQSSMLTL